MTNPSNLVITGIDGYFTLIFLQKSGLYDNLIYVKIQPILIVWIQFYCSTCLMPTSHAYFDCINFYFEIDKEDDFRKSFNVSYIVRRKAHHEKEPCIFIQGSNIDFCLFYSRVSLHLLNKLICFLCQLLCNSIINLHFFVNICYPSSQSLYILSYIRYTYCTFLNHF